MAIWKAVWPARGIPAIRTDRPIQQLTMPKVRFESDGIEVDVPFGTSILDASRAGGAQVGSACGGVCACSTCHVYVKQGLDALSEANDREEDIMDKAFDVRPQSRLGCQAKILRDVTIVCEISPESRKAFLDEHPDIRKAAAHAPGA
jgi:ferredoxin, 2Fe-2S